MAKKYVLLICMLSFISLILYITGDHYGATVALDLKVCNGYFRTICHRARYVLPQLVHNVRMWQILTMKGRKISQVASRVSQKKIDGSTLTAPKSASLIPLHVQSIYLPCCTGIRYNTLQLQR